MDSTKLDSLKLWFHENGGRLQQGIEVCYDPQFGYYLCATQDLDYSKPLVHCPISLTLSSLNVDRASNEWTDEFFSRFDKTPYAIIRFILVDEYLSGSSSWWWPYIALLPQPQGNNGEPPFNTPLWFSEDDLQWLNGTGLALAAEEREVAWKKEFNDGLKYLQDSKNLSLYTWFVRKEMSLIAVQLICSRTLYKWAATVLSSRCFPSRPPPEKHDSSHLGGGVSQMEKARSSSLSPLPVLCPVLDLANHNPKTLVTWIINEDGYTLFSSERTEKGKQLYNNYGLKGNQERKLRTRIPVK
jgi:protein-histidine N-methyltransferase